MANWDGKRPTIWFNPQNFKPGDKVIVQIRKKEDSGTLLPY